MSKDSVVLASLSGAHKHQRKLEPFLKETTMTKRISPGILVAVFAGVLISGLATRLEARERCSDASLRGSYAFNVSGTNVSNPYLPLGPFAAVGRNTYDGNGHMRGVIVVSSNGSIIPATYTGTYAVKSDCTGVKSATLSIGAVVDFAFVIDSNLREIQMIATQAGPPNSQADGLTVSGSARKLFTDAESKH